MVFSGHVCILLIILFPVHLFAQERVITRNTIDSILNPALLEEGKVLHFESSEINVGELSEDDAPAVYHFHFQNIGKKAVRITRISTSCGCTEAKFEEAVIRPGEKGEIALVFNPFQQGGKLYKQAFVYTSLSDRFPTAKIALVGMVKPTSDKWADYPYRLGNSLRMRQPMLRFRNMSLEEVRTERSVCVGTGEKPLELSALLIPPYATFRTEPERIVPGMEADLVVTIDGKLLPPGISDEFTFPIILKGMDATPSERTLQVKVSLQNEYN